MALIQSYPSYAPVNDGDRWIGTNSTNGSTRNFTAQQIADYLNINGKISVSAQMIFKLTTAVVPGNGQFSGPITSTAMNTVTTLVVSPVDVSDANTVAFITYLIGNNILISEQNNINNFGHYTIVSYVIKAGGGYTLTLTPLAGNGNFEVNKFYDFALFTLTTQGTPTFIFEQAVAATTWDINHNLGKFPSVTVINNNNIVINGEVTYIDTNNIQLNFSAGFSGKAYLN